MEGQFCRYATDREAQAETKPQIRRLPVTEDFYIFLNIEFAGMLFEILEARRLNHGGFSLIGKHVRLPYWPRG
ncbi:MAG: hypothetical protein BGO03_01770 [Mesorhizobium sp. 61-13]|nr:MAG: hypothetical protein BGO03_01770 [Mesorhizobium sp. 61-13]